MNPVEARFCQGCGFELTGSTQHSGGQWVPPAQHQPIKNYLVESILVTTLCCLPFGIVALLNSVRVDTEVARGDYAAANRSAEAAKKYSIWGAVSQLVIYFLVIVIAMIAAILTEPRPAERHEIPPSLRELSGTQGFEEFRPNL
jgi:hypothetical protein